MSRGLAAVTSLTLAASLAPSAALAAPATASATTVAAAAADLPVADYGQRITAADVFGLGSDDTLLGRTGDCNFVIGIWEHIRDRSAAREVRSAAEQAFTEDGRACFDFIVTGIFAAKRRDDATAIAEAAEKRRSDLARSKAAASIDVVADATLLSGSDGEFARRIWERVADDAKWPKVKAAAREARDGSAEQQRQFVDAGMADAARQDNNDAIIIDGQKTEAEKARLRDRAAKQSAANRIGLTVGEELLSLPDRDFIIQVWNSTPDGSHVQDAAIAATRSPDPAVWKAFIDTGVHTAVDEDIKDALDAEDAEKRRLTEEVLARAERSGHRNLVIAARAALAGSPDDRAVFIRVGQTAVRPDLPDVLQAGHSGLCLAVTDSSTEVRKPVVQRACNAGADRGWKMFPRTDGSAQLRNGNSGLCLAVLGGSTVQGTPAVQYTCGDVKDQQWTSQITAAGLLRLRNVNSGLCLAVDGASKSDPAPVVQRTCGTTPEQGWQLRPRGLVNLEAGDFTADGRDDLLAVDVPSGGLFLYPGVATGGPWGARVKVGTGWTGMGKLVVGEFNRDGFLDLIAVETATGRLWLYPGTATGARFGARVDIGSGWNGYEKLTAGEFTRDAYPDLVTVEAATGRQLLYAGTATGGRFAPAVAIGAGWNGFGNLAAGELTRDAFPDMTVLETATGRLLLYAGTATGGRFAPAIVIGTGWNGFNEITIGEFTGDAFADLVTVNPANGRLLLYAGTAAGERFAPAIAVGIGG